MPESTETLEQQPVKSRLERIAGPAVFAGFFIVWPITNLTCAVIGYKAIDKQLRIEELKAAANATLQS